MAFSRCLSLVLTVMVCLDHVSGGTWELNAIGLGLSLFIGHIHGAGLPGLSRSVWHAKKDHRAACYDKPL